MYLREFKNSSLWNLILTSNLKNSLLKIAYFFLSTGGFCIGRLEIILGFLLKLEVL